MSEDKEGYEDFRTAKIGMSKESEELIQLIKKNLCEVFERDVSLAETINMLVAMGIDSWMTMKNEEEAENLT